MKRTLLLGMLLTSVSVYAFMGPERPMNTMTFEELNLTSEQKARIKTIYKESRNERIKLMDQMDDLRDETQERVMAVLDKEQKKAFIALRKEMRKRPKKACGGHGTMPMRKPKCDR
jgi:Spy/CpxP family protein refolding chaperone